MAGRLAIVDGDVTLDWNLARGQGSEGRGVSASRQPGGAALLGELVAAVAADLPAGPVEVLAPQAPEGVVPTDERFDHNFSIWKHFEDDEMRAWRVERSLGVQRAVVDSRGRPSGDAPGQAEPELIVLHDSGLGFRDRPQAWPRAIGEVGGRGPWILMRMAKPVAEGALWEHLEPFAERMIVVIHIDDLRLGAVRITRELSWERTAQDLVWELLYGTQTSRLAQCAHVIVSFTTAGALMLSAAAESDAEPSCRLVFDPAVMERMWNEKHRGAMIGGISALTAGIARQLMLSPEEPDVALGVQRGIEAMRVLDLNGYAEQADPAGNVRIAYPLGRIAEELSSPERPLVETPVCGPSRSRPIGADVPRAEQPWTILEDRHPGDLVPLAVRIVLEGPKRALTDAPRGEFRKLTTFDRQEIEGLQSIRTLIRQYAMQEHPTQPLSIAVFGPPGSGKSWSVRQVAKAVLPGQVEPITFNLSQFDDPRELIDALHQVRDISLGGELPLVLWDEFDATRMAMGMEQKLGWLPHFLSPMEDGEFQDGQLTHPIGPAVFVFAGGVYERMQDFVEDSSNFEHVKAPDFVSRLSGYVNVAGPNPRDGDAKADPYYLIRRAVLLRSLLQQHSGDIFREVDGVDLPDIDEGVLRALLLAREYRHGARSLGSIIATSTVPERGRLERSDLPSEAQLDLHVDARKFLELVHCPTVEGEMLEHLAEAAHILHCAEELAKGAPWEEADNAYLAGKPLLRQYADRDRGPAASSDPGLVAYAKLSESRKESWREQVRGVPNQLVAAGHLTRSMRDGEPLSDLVDLRLTLESAAVERAAEDGDRDELNEAREMLVEMRRPGIAPEEFQAADVRFHIALAGASGNEAMHLMMLAVRNAIATRLSEALRRDTDSEATLRRLAEEHGEILQAVEDHESDRARALVREHLTSFYRPYVATGSPSGVGSSSS